MNALDRINLRVVLLAALVLAPASAAVAASVGPVPPPSSSLSYVCGRAGEDHTLGVPPGTRVCGCDKTKPGDCRAMADEACKDGLLTCFADSKYCVCKEKPGGVSIPKLKLQRNLPTAPGNSGVAR